MTGKQLRYLRGRAHHLEPVVMIGRRGVSASVIRQVEQALIDHELIKVKVLEDCPDGHEQANAILALQTEAHVVGRIGRITILYRARPEKPRIHLPDDNSSSPEGLDGTTQQGGTEWPTTSD